MALLREPEFLLNRLPESYVKQQRGAELQPVVYASRVYRVACFGLVRENSHGYEICRLSVFDSLLAVLVRFVTTWKEGG